MEPSCEDLVGPYIDVAIGVKRLVVLIYFQVTPVRKPVRCLEVALRPLRIESLEQFLRRVEFVTKRLVGTPGHVRKHQRMMLGGHVGHERAEVASQEHAPVLGHGGLLQRSQRFVPFP